jgi:uncharacterized membrane-anchored protein YitT (DUF2179 family)
MMWLLETPRPDRHAPLEDLQGILVGTALVAFAIQLLTHPGLITGQIAGLALVLSYAGGWSFGAIFLLLNLPFYALAISRFGWVFTAKSFSAVLLLSGFSELLPAFVSFDRLDPLAAALLFGVAAGVGLLSLFRHGASLGGVGIVALYLQERTGFKAGWTQLIFDVCVFAVAFALFDPLTVLYSLTGAVVLNLIIAVNHRRDRYIAS